MKTARIEAGIRLRTDSCRLIRDSPTIALGAHCCQFMAVGPVEFRHARVSTYLFVFCEHGPNWIISRDVGPMTNEDIIDWKISIR